MKRAFSLIEVIISFTLLTFLLTTLFFWYHHFSSKKEELNKLRGPLVEERYAHQRLMQILPKAQLPFFTKEREESLVFLFDRGVWIDPQLSGTILANLYLDIHEKCLCLTIWPKPEKENGLIRFPSQTFILLDHVNGLSFDFYAPPNPFKKPVDPREVGKPQPQEGWQKNWKGEYQTLPALVKLSIEREPCGRFKKTRLLEYTFDLPYPLIYPKEIEES